MTRHDLLQLRLYAHAALLQPERSWRAMATPSRTLVAWFVDHSRQLDCPTLPPLDRADVELGVGDVEARTWAALKPMVATLDARRSVTPSGLERRLA